MDSLKDSLGNNGQVDLSATLTHVVLKATTGNTTIEEPKAMMSSSFPIDSSRRRAIFVLHNHDIKKCGYEPGGADVLLDDEAYVLPFPLAQQQDLPSAFQNVLDADLVRPGVVLVQSPYDRDTYAEVDKAPQLFALAKHMYFSQLCMLLGAKEVVVDQVDLRTRSGKSTYNFKAERNGASLEADIQSEDLAKFRAQMHLHDEFEGGSTDVIAAEQLLRDKRLWNDPGLKALVEMRRDGANKIKTRTLVMSLSSEAKSNLNVVGRIKIPAFVNLTGNYDRVIKEHQEFTLTVTVKF